MMANIEKYSERDNREAVELYLVSEEGSVSLTDKQKGLLNRWEYADELIRQNMWRREEISLMIQRKFTVSRATAYQDIVNAENIFSSSTPLNKRYRIQLRIELLETQINSLWGYVKPAPFEEPEELFDRISRIKSNEEYINQAIALEKVLKGYYDIYPDTKPTRSPKTIIFQVAGNILPPAPMNVGDALARATTMLHIKANETNNGNRK